MWARIATSFIYYMEEIVHSEISKDPLALFFTWREAVRDLVNLYHPTSIGSHQKAAEAVRQAYLAVKQFSDADLNSVRTAYEKMLIDDFALARSMVKRTRIAFRRSNTQTHKITAEDIR